MASQDDSTRQMSDEDLQAALDNPDDYTDKGLERIQREIMRRNSTSELESDELIRNSYIDQTDQTDQTEFDRAVTPVVITDIKMTFGSMVAFMVKWSLAAIPAMIILLVIGAIISTMFGGLFASFLR